MNKELKELIEKYCMGMVPTDAQRDEIYDLALVTGVGSTEVSNYMQEMQNGPTREERMEAERKAKEEADRKAKERAERERKAREEAERKAQEEAERKAREKAERERKEREEAERKAREKAERERKAREEAARKAKEKEEYERRLREDPAFARAEKKKAEMARKEAERKAKEEAKRKAQEEAERERKEKAKRRAKKRAERKEEFKRAMKRVVLPIFIVLLLAAGAFFAIKYWDKLQTLFGGKSQTEETVDAPGEIITVNGVSFKMVAVEGGTFEMGSETGSDDEKPVHNVTLGDYMIGETEVTQALWEAVMEDNPSEYTGENRPVQNVSWHDCQTFIKRLNQLTGKNFRLPTEAEWEYAARGGHKSKGIYPYSGSHKAKDVAWYDCRRPHEVKMKRPNELGVYDMSGNVEEWCADWYDESSYSYCTSLSGPSSGEKKVYRGGGFDGWSEQCCSVSNRDYADPDYDSDSRGLRLVLSEEPSADEEEMIEQTEVLDDEGNGLSDEIDESKVKFILQSYCNAIVNNDFNTLSELYAPMVERFQGAYNESRDQVVDRHRKYDQTFKVNSKKSLIHWDKFEVEMSDKGRINAVIVEDYSIDREDKSQYSKFVLEKHFVLNEDYQIVSVYDNQLSKSN